MPLRGPDRIPVMIRATPRASARANDLALVARSQRHETFEFLAVGLGESSGHVLDN